MDANACKLMKEAIADEEDAIRLYSKISRNSSVLGLENLHIIDIQRDEEKHRDTLDVMLAECIEEEEEFKIMGEENK